VTNGGGPFKATGSSGGATEIGYALSTCNREVILDRVAPRSGPPTTRCDYICNDADDYSTTICPEMLALATYDCNGNDPPCLTGPNNPVCVSCSGPDATDEELYDDSILHPNADLVYSTEIRMLLGQEDCEGVAIAQAMLWFTEIDASNDKTVKFVAGTGHQFFLTPEGRNAIKRALTGP
jgi:hypothetical protein